MDSSIQTYCMGYNAVEEYVLAVEAGEITYANMSAVSAAGRSLVGTPIERLLDPYLFTVLNAEMPKGRNISVPDTKFIDYPCRVDVFAGEPNLLVFRKKPHASPDQIPFTFRSLSAVSREMREPLSALFASANQLKKRLPKDDDKAKQYMSAISRNAYELIRLTNNLVDMSRFSSTDDGFRPEETEFVGFIRGIAQSAAPLAGIKGVEITFESSVPTALLNIDREKIERLLLNLLSNSIKFTREGNAIKVRVGVSGSDVFLTVIDSGAGIREDILPYAFNAYELGSSHPEKGYGLGLCLVRAIAELHGGRVMLQTKEGQGTTVIASIPISAGNTHPPLRQKLPHYDYAGNLPHLLLELCDVFETEEFETAAQLVASVK